MSSEVFPCSLVRCQFCGSEG